MSSYKCATCGRAATYAGPLPTLYPFCSERCKWVDLGQWLRGEYTIDRDLTAEELPDSPKTDCQDAKSAKDAKGGP